MVSTSHAYDFLPTNIILSGISATVMFIANTDPLVSFGFSVALFIIGKGLDVAIKLYFDRKKKK